MIRLDLFKFLSHRELIPNFKKNSNHLWQIRTFLSKLHKRCNVYEWNIKCRIQDNAICFGLFCRLALSFSREMNTKSVLKLQKIYLRKNIYIEHAFSLVLFSLSRRDFYCRCFITEIISSRIKEKIPVKKIPAKKFLAFCGYGMYGEYTFGKNS